MRITLNGDQFEIPGTLSVTSLLGMLEVDPRRVAVEHNHEVVRRAAFDVTMIDEGDSVEIVNFVGGGCNG